MSHKLITNKYIKVGPFYYRFKLGLTIITLITVAILLYLCTWQLGRSFEKKHLIAQLQEKTLRPPTMLLAIKDVNLKTHRFTPVTVQRTYLNQYTFLLDNQMYKSKVGYRVLTAFQSPYLGKWVLIDRGWVQGTASREHLPAIQDVYGVQTLVGTINTIPSGIVLKKDLVDANTSWPFVIQALDYTLIEQSLQHPVYHFVVQLQPSTDPTGIYSMPPIEFGVTSAKHLGYAFQWFMFAVIALVYYVINSCKRIKN